SEENYRKLKPGRISLTASYHPEQERSLKGFVEKTDMLRSNGFPVVVCMVAFPPNLPKMASWLDAFYRKGVFVIVFPFMGTWRDRPYPQAYTSLEKEFITGANQFLYMYPGLDIPGESVKCLNFATIFMLNGASPRGKLCNAGVNYCRILLSGEIVRCGQYGTMDEATTKSEILGNLFKTDFHLPEKAMPCPFDACGCLGESYYMAGGPLGPPKGNAH
ncbi:MAG: hypothetical protein AAB359_01130, partial [Elusimicrobiota bacterium]